MFRCVLAFAAACLFSAIFVNNSLILVSASAVSFPVGMLPFSATVSCWAAATTSDSGEISGLVMY
jgi:hypothetical protein